MVSTHTLRSVCVCGDRGSALHRLHVQRHRLDGLGLKKHVETVGTAFGGFRSRSHHSPAVCRIFFFFGRFRTGRGATDRKPPGKGDRTAGQHARRRSLQWIARCGERRILYVFDRVLDGRGSQYCVGNENAGAVHPAPVAAGRQVVRSRRGAAFTIAPHRRAPRRTRVTGRMRCSPPGFRLGRHSKTGRPRLRVPAPPVAR